MSLARIPFSEMDHSVIRTLNGWMLFLAIVHFLVAVLALTCGCMGTASAVGTISRAPIGGVLYTLQM